MTENVYPSNSLPPLGSLILSSSCLCLPCSIMMTGTARLPESQVPTLMSACLTPLLSAQVSPHPCSCDLQRPPWLMWRRDRAGSRGKGNSLFSFSLSPLSLFIYDISSMTRDMVWPQGERATYNTLVTVTPKADSVKCCGSLTDHKTIAPLPITLRESAGLKFGLNEGYHRISRKVEPWGVNNGYIWGEKRGVGRFNALIVTMSVAGVI